MFKINPLYLTDGYKVGHKAMLAPGTTKLYGTWIPRSTKHAPKGITKIVSFGQQLTWKYIHDVFEEYFFFTIKRKSFDRACVNGDSSFTGYTRNELKAQALQFVKDMAAYLGMEYDGKHFEELWELGYLPLRIKALPEGIETDPNIPHMTFVNTIDGFAWLTLYMETMVSNLAWKASTAATIAKLYRRQCTEWVMKTDPAQAFLIDFMCHDFSARGLSGPFDMIAVGLGHATSFKGSDTLATIPASRYYYGVGKDEMPVFSVNASEHSVSTTKIFTVGEQQMIADWIKIFPNGILSIVSDTFNLWKLITEYLPANKEAIMARDGKLVIRPDSGDPVDIICGFKNKVLYQEPQVKGVIELLWDIFGGTVNEQGYKVLDPHIGAIYGDSITPDRQRQIYERLAAKGFAVTNIVLGIGSYTYEYLTRDTLGFAAKGAWFEISKEVCDYLPTQSPEALEPACWTEYESYNIYKDPVTDGGTKKSLKGLLCVRTQSFAPDLKGIEVEPWVQTECTPEEENQGLLQVIYEDGKFHNQTTLEQVRSNLTKI